MSTFSTSPKSQFQVLSNSQQQFPPPPPPPQASHVHSMLMDNAPFMPAPTPFTPSAQTLPDASLDDRRDSQTTLVDDTEASWIFRLARKISSSASLAAGKVWAIATSSPETTRNDNNATVSGDRLV